MREIKFRFYDDKVSKRMIYQDPIERMDRIFVKWEFTPKPSPLMQYTGLKDKNDKEIYEGDIVDFDGKKHMVTFANGGFGIWKEMRTNLYSDETRKYHEPLWNLVVDGCEIIGNIYENPELIK